MENKNTQPFLSLRRAAAESRREFATVKQWVAKGLLPTVPVGKTRVAIPRAAFEKFLLEGKATPPLGEVAA